MMPDAPAPMMRTKRCSEMGGSSMVGRAGPFAGGAVELMEMFGGSGFYNGVRVPTQL